MPEDTDESRQKEAFSKSSSTENQDAAVIFMAGYCLTSTFSPASVKLILSVVRKFLDSIALVLWHVKGSV